ncbi:hypothetical protein A9J31_00465 [Acinetobacter gandensis]|uniref:Uncharacterized protein n=1 Tax=Acinetobacter gandensis TaxID=1443941 RepID=A0A1A7RCN9_9GAMM|nr:hypothetical protein A9J31_00465 [Acinetobacter gandensis]
MHCDFKENNTVRSKFKEQPQYRLMTNRAEFFNKDAVFVYTSHMVIDPHMMSILWFGDRVI